MINNNSIVYNKNLDPFNIMGPLFALNLNFSETKRSSFAISLTVHHCATISQLRKQLMDYRLLAAEEVSKHINGDH